MMRSATIYCIRGRFYLGTLIGVGRIGAIHEQDHAHSSPLVIRRANTSALLSTGSIWASVATGHQGSPSKRPVPIASIAPGSFWALRIVLKIESTCKFKSQCYISSGSVSSSYNLSIQNGGAQIERCPNRTVTIIRTASSGTRFKASFLAPNWAPALKTS